MSAQTSSNQFSCRWRESHTGSKRGWRAIEHRQRGRSRLAGGQGCEYSSRRSGPPTCSSRAKLKPGISCKSIVFVFSVGTSSPVVHRRSERHHAESSCWQTVSETHISNLLWIQFLIFVWDVLPLLLDNRLKKEVTEIKSYKGIKQMGCRFVPTPTLSITSSERTVPCAGFSAARGEARMMGMRFASELLGEKPK